MNKLQALKFFAIIFIFVGEPILFNLNTPFSVPFLFLEHTWPIQAVVGYALVLISIDISNWTIARRIITLVIIVPFFCLAGMFLWRISLPEPRYPFPFPVAI